MATQKRRVVYMSDEEWKQVGEDATGMHMSISGWIRAMMLGDLNQPHVEPPMVFTPRTQADRDAILRRINKGKD